MHGSAGLTNRRGAACREPASGNGSHDPIVAVPRQRRRIGSVGREAVFGVRREAGQRQGTESAEESRGATRNSASLTAVVQTCVSPLAGAVSVPVTAGVGLGGAE
ncbi:hypothetical protein MATL_G00063740 [Megalops atlanticus]|uniref:Uncharacterized protein n=1 Tax=Megalops atlanticus TaxID=7932 RepID=A0A9D3Q8G7_MEGAT|nr:hypothetical protein MATL_G00063740 [Megalops atlanticus]